MTDRIDPALCPPVPALADLRPTSITDLLEFADLAEAESPQWSDEPSWWPADDTTDAALAVRARLPLAARISAVRDGVLA